MTSKTQDKVLVSAWKAMPLHKPSLIVDSQGSPVDYDNIICDYEEVLEFVQETTNQLIQDHHEIIFQVMRDVGTRGSVAGTLASRRILNPVINIPKHYKSPARVKRIIIKLVWASLGPWAATPAH